MAEVLITETVKTAEPSSFNTQEAFEKAVTRAEALAIELQQTTPYRWRGRVRNNIKWYYSARDVSDRITVWVNLYGDEIANYSACVHEPEGTGAPSYRWGAGKTPAAAVADALKNAREFIAKQQAILEGL